MCLVGKAAHVAADFSADDLGAQVVDPGNGGQQQDRCAKRLDMGVDLPIDRGDGRVETKEFTMRKGQTQQIEVSHGEAICWRHDRNPNNPVPGVWSGWSRVPLAPGQTAETDL